MSQYIVSARKYRPKTFDEVIGQQHVGKTLQLALSNDQLAHAFLFTGPRGVGKTTCARILAKLINCENPIDKKDPCDKCDSCRTFNENSSFNIIELDGASNNKVEHIRTMIQQVRIAPQNGNYKVFIIDEVHMLTTQAFNAFLKTLEEPPPYAIFILATTEKHKIIPTILSRCQIFDFKRIQVPEIVKQLEGICEKENIVPEKEALTVIAQKADGAMRDALSIYDRIAGSVKDNLTYKDVITNLNLLDYDYFFELTDALVQEDLSEVLLIFDKILKQGFNPDQLIAGLSQHFRELLVCKDPRTITLLEYSEKLKERYYNQSQVCNKKFLLTSLNILNQCDINLPRAKNKNLHTEIALAKITYINKAVEFAPQSIEKKKIVQANPSPKSTINTTNSQSLVSENPKPNPAPSTIINTNDTSKTDDTSPANNEENLSSENTELSKPKTEKETPQNKQTEKKVEKKIEKETKVSALDMPSLDVDHLLNKIAETNKEKEASKLEVTIENVKNIWNDYISTIESAAIKTCLKTAIYEIGDEHTLKVYTPNNISKSDILSQKELLENMRTAFLIPNYSFDIIVDIEKFPNIKIPKKKKVLSNKEKYELIIEQNPNVENFIKKFDLKLKQ